MEEYLQEVLARLEERDEPIAVDTMIKINNRWGVSTLPKAEPTHHSPKDYIKSYFKWVRSKKKFD